MALYNAETFKEEFLRVIRASQSTGNVRACLLTTRDREYALSMVKKIAVECAFPLYHFTVAGRYRYNHSQFKWDTIGNALADAPSLLKHAQEVKGGGVILIEDCSPFFKDEGGDQRVRMTIADMLSSHNGNSGAVLVFLEPPEAGCRLPTTTADQFVRLEVPYPRIEELERIATETIALISHKLNMDFGMEKIQAEAKRLATGMVGLTRSAARDALIDAMILDPGNFNQAYDRLQERKSQQLSRELKMNILDTAQVEDPIGLDYLVEYLIVNKEKMLLSGPERARGIILIGPPGTGKTMLARAIGRVVGLPVVEFRISSLMNSLLGETERRFSQSFATLEAMAPNVVFIDEVEKAFGDSSERDGGTMMRCTGSLLSWFSDNPYPNFIVATSNSLKRMGEIGLTMTRSERFDASFFVDVPNAASRRLMLVRWLSGKVTDIDDVSQELANCTEKFSGADLRSIVKKAITRAEYTQAELTIDILKDEAERKRMRALALYDEFQELRRWGRMHCDPAGPTED
jgi:hypothetical protein